MGTEKNGMTTEDAPEAPPLVLVVEDGAAVRKSMAAALAEEGYRLLEAEDGAAGIALFRSNTPDIVITDIIMPVTDGHEVVKRVVSESPDTGIIVVSGSGNIADVVKAIKLGTWDYILKPIADMQVLLHSVEKAIEKRKLIFTNRRYRENLEAEISVRTAELQNSLGEKEQLLKEVHHRVKNNLQIITSLLSLQIGIETCEECVAPMEKMKNRINSMALVHERLYSSGELSRIPLKEYIEDLTGDLVEGFHTSGRSASVKTDFPSVLFPIETAVPVGLIVNELVSNSLQHAFPASGGGTVRVSMHFAGGRCMLEVSDDGIGLPVQAFPEGNGRSLGFVLVSTLVKQLGGTMEVRGGDGGHGGTGFLIIFPFPA